MLACPWRTGIAALCHPLSLASITLLLLNDHLLKRLAPSLLTGKLSDFAGLFFFPLLLGALLGLLPGRLRASPRLAPRIAFCLTFAVFAAIKTLPAANAWFSQSAGSLLGVPVAYALDPTDLLALVMLLPAWRLWQRMQGARPSPFLGYAALAAGSLASLATSPCMTPIVVDRLSVDGAAIYARGNSSTVLQSQDGGRSWTLLENPSQPLLQSFEAARALPVQVCDPTRPGECYRVSSSGVKVEMSADDGKTWQLGWQIPPGRLEFMQRYRSGFLVSCNKDVNTAVFDLAIAPPGSGSRLVAAMGTEGVLVRLEDGSWQRYQAYLTNGPTPFSENRLDVISNITTLELALGVVIVYLFLLIMAIWTGVQVTPYHLGGELPRARARILRPLWLGPLLLAADIGLALLTRSNGLLLAAPVVVLAIPVALWVTSALASSSPARMAGVALSVLGAALLALAAAWLPLVLWAYGTIPYYNLSLSLSLFLFAAVLFWFTLKLVGRVQRICVG